MSGTSPQSMSCFRFESEIEVDTTEEGDEGKYSMFILRSSEH